VTPEEEAASAEFLRNDYPYWADQFKENGYTISLYWTSNSEIAATVIGTPGKYQIHTLTPERGFDVAHAVNAENVAEAKQIASAIMRLINLSKERHG